jgi:hypothetical protein
MDVSLYISELLKKNGEITVPGLGFLVRARKSAYYNDAEGKFYPPYHQTLFDPQDIEDDTLPQYVADKKNISLASAKYFIEKYIESLRHDALVKQVEVADLGWFYMDQAVMSFKANDALTEDGGLYGYPQVEVHKHGQKTGKKNTHPPVYVTEDIPPITFSSKSTEDKSDNERFPSVLQLDRVHEHKVRRRYTILYTLLSVVIILALAFLTVYQFAPATYQKFLLWERQLRGLPAEDTVIRLNVKTIPIEKHIIDTAKTDSLKKTDSTAKVDSAAKQKLAEPITVNKPIAQPPTITPAATKPPPAKTTSAVTAKNGPVLDKHPIILIKRVIKPAKKDTTSKNGVVQQADENNVRSHYELIVGNSSTLAGAYATINRLRELGVSGASISIDMPGPENYITIGTYSTFAEAEKERLKLLKENKISNTSYTQTFKPQ